MTRIASILLLTSLGACLVTKPIGEAETDAATTGPTSTADEAESGPGMTSMVDTTGDPDGDPFRVDCAERDWSMDDLGQLSGAVGGGEPGPLGYPIAACNPRTSGEANGYKCCSTDPATADGLLPAYEGRDIPDSSAPLYADAANGAGTWGVCIRTNDIPLGSGLLAAAATNCPVPCNPTWEDGEIEAVCGATRVCCQTHEVREKDCVQEDGVWRPVTGNDIGAAGIVPTTYWSNVSHDTHQDPNGTVCLAYAGGPSSDAFVDCIRQLNVANQRGFCMSLEPGQVCPGDRDPPPSGTGYRDVCDMMNG
jgi:hypothetical protein